MRAVACLTVALLFLATAAAGQVVDPAYTYNENLQVNGNLIVNGAIGVNTTSVPARDLHIRKGNTPAIRFEQDTSGGYAAHTWDLKANEKEFYLSDVTNGDQILFLISTGAPLGSLVIDSSGQVGMGAGADPAYALHIQRTGENAAVVVDRTDGAINYINATSTYGNFGTVNNFPLRFMVNGTWRGRINTDNSWSFVNGASLTAGGVFTNASSRDLKQGIAPLTTEAAMAALDGLAPVTYAYTADPADTRVGFIAEEVPELVAEPDRRGLSPMEIVAVLTKALQEERRLVREQQRINEEQGKAIEQLLSEMDWLRKQDRAQQ